MAIPDSKKIYPREGDDTIVYLKNVITNPNIEVGDFTFYNDFVNDPRDFEKNNVLYHYPINHDKLKWESSVRLPVEQSFCLTVQTTHCDRFPLIHFQFSMMSGNTEFGRTRLGTTRATLWSATMSGSGLKPLFLQALRLVMVQS